jgi:ferredoxin
VSPSRVVADREMCMGSGNCVVECPEVFALDDESVVIVVDQDPPAELREKVQNAVDACPAGCLALED